ncbi:hypothetical protein NP493_853g01023, partial [Ridgeia piscesae]
SEVDRSSSHNCVLRFQFAEREDTEDKLKLQLSEMEEENEIYAEEKGIMEVGATELYGLEVGATELYGLEVGATELYGLEVGAYELRERLEQLRTSQEVRLSVEEKVVLVQAAAMLNVADKVQS